MTGSFAACVALSIAGGFFAFLAFLNDRAYERHDREEKEAAAKLHAAE